MKRIAIAVVVGSTLAALAGGVTADERIGLPGKSTYADSHPVTSPVATAFPSAVDEFGIVRLRSASTYADQHKGTAGGAARSAIPQGLDEGIFLEPMPASLEAEVTHAN